MTEEFVCDRIGEAMENPSLVRSFARALESRGAGLGRRVLMAVRDFLERVREFFTRGTGNPYVRKYDALSREVGRILAGMERAGGAVVEAAGARVYSVANVADLEASKAKVEDFLSGKIARKDGSGIAYGITPENREMVSAAAKSVIDAFANKRIPLSTGKYLYFSPDSRTISAYEGDMDTAWAEYALHLVTHRGKTKDGGFARFFDERNINDVLPNIESIVKEDKVKINNGRFLFFGKENIGDSKRNSNFTMLVTEADPDGNLACDLRYITGMVQRGFLPGDTATLGEVVAESPTIGRAPSPATGDNITPETRLSVTHSENFRKWFGNSKVVDEDGEPLVVYHGTSEEFTVFDMDKGRANMDIQGAFFSPWEDDAMGYGRNVGAFYLRIENPAPEGVAYKVLNSFKGQNEAGRKAREKLISMGYDGVDNGGEEYIAFYPNQVKSATDNNGGYSLENPDVRYSVSNLYTGTSADYDRPSLHYVGTGEGLAVWQVCDGHG